MKIPVWFAAVIVGAMLSGVGACLEHLSSKMDDMQKDIVTLKVDVAEVKARMPGSVHAEIGSPAQASITNPLGAGWIYP